MVSSLTLLRSTHSFSRAPSLSLCQHLYGALNILRSIQSLLRHSSTVSQQERYSSGLVCALQLGFSRRESLNRLPHHAPYVLEHLITAVYALSASEVRRTSTVKDSKASVKH